MSSVTTSGLTMIRTSRPAWHGVGLVHAGVGVGELLQLLQAADIILHVLSPGTGTGGGDGIGGLNQHGDDGLGLHVPVVGLDGIDDDGIFLVLPGEIRAQLHMAALHLVVDGFAQVMQ